MQHLWAPWRSEYIQEFRGAFERTSDCFMCDAWTQPEHDVETLVVARSTHSFVMMNRYPYTSGHCMVMPAQHIGELYLLSEEEFRDVMNMVRTTAQVIQNVFSPHGMNIGANIGTAAGAGMPGHLHFHLVPRWSGDANFMPVIGDTKIISESLEITYKKLTEGFAQFFAHQT